MPDEPDIHTIPPAELAAKELEARAERAPRVTISADFARTVARLLRGG